MLAPGDESKITTQITGLYDNKSNGPYLYVLDLDESITDIRSSVPGQNTGKGR